MSIYVYPENWEEPIIPEPVILTTQELADLKVELKDYVIQKNEPVRISKLLKTGEKWTIKELNKHIQNSIILEIIFEIREEWGYPGQGGEAYVSVPKTKKDKRG